MMDGSIQKLFRQQFAMDNQADGALSDKQKEMLIVMTALAFIEQNALMTQAQLNDARRSLQALFIRTSGEETMLRKLVEILKVNKDLHEAFSSIAKISASIATSVDIFSRKINYLKEYVGKLQLTPEESAEFFAPFLSFSHAFQERILRFNQLMTHYLELREDEAKRTHEFRIAQDASRRLKDRLSGRLGAQTTGEMEESMKQEVLGNFDYASARNRLMEAQRESRMSAKQVNQLLYEVKAMCQMAMNPDMRERSDYTQHPTPEFDDIFMRFTRSIKKYPRLQQIKDFIIDYFKLYQRAYGMFVLDFDTFNKAVETITTNTEEYFESKQEDEDIRAKRDKLRKYEGLIPFLEDASGLIPEYEDYGFTKFSRRLSEAISTQTGQWDHIREELLVAKVAAEADLTTRLDV